MTDLAVRQAEHDDAAAMAELDAAAIARGHVVYFDRPAAIEPFTSWLFETTHGTWLAARGGAAIAWACLHRLHERAAFASTAELFVCPDQEGAAVAALVDAALATARARGLRSVVYLASSSEVVPMLRTRSFAPVGELIASSEPRCELTMLQVML